MQTFSKKKRMEMSREKRIKDVARFGQNEETAKMLMQSWHSQS